MTTSPTISPKESLLTGAPSSSPATASPGRVFYCEFSPSRPVQLPNTASLASIIKRYEADPEKAKLLADARQDLAKTLYADEPETLTGLRLAAGLSQIELAERVGTSQPHLARIERGQNDPGTDLIARIAKALNLEEDRVFRAIRYQVATRGQST